MGARGPKPQPTATKEARGNPGKRRLNEWEPIPPKGEVNPPRSLRGDALDVWKREAPIAIAMRTLTTADVTLFTIYCRRVAELEMVENDILDMKEAKRDERANAGESGYDARHPLVDVSGDGGVHINRLASLRRELAAEVRDLGDRFGMSPVSRTKINVRLGDGLTPNVRPAPGSREAKQEGVLGRVIGGVATDGGGKRLSIG
jgi:phage terminase small subunit